MPTNKEKQKIRKMAAKGHSINHIQKQLNLPKSTIYYHFRKEVGQKQKENQLTIPKNPQHQGEICGIYAGDGNYYKDKNYKHRVKFTLNIHDDYWKTLSEFLEEVLDKKPHINHQEKYNRTNLRYESKVLIDFLRENLDWDKSDKTGTIRLSDKKFSKEFQIGFLRGLLDTDGYVGKEYRKTTFNSISKHLTQDVARILSENEIKNKISLQPDKRENCRDMYRVILYGDSADQLEELIKPRHPKKIRLN